MSREPTATHRIGHISDSHFTASGLLHGRVRTGDTFAAALDALAGSGVPVDAVVHTGDVADEGEADAYRAARAVLDAATLERARGPRQPRRPRGDARAPARPPGVH